MANAKFKIILFLNHPRGGWSETYYTDSANLVAAQATAASLAFQRNMLLAPPCDMEAYRVSQDDQARNSILIEFAPSAGFTATVEGSDAPWMAYLTRLRATSTGVQRQLYLRGIPDELFDQNDPTNVVQQAWASRFLNFFAPALVSGAFYIKGKTPTSGLPDGFIQSWTAGVLENSTLVTSDRPTTLVAGQKVTVYKLNGFPKAPGLCLVTSNSPTSPNFTLRLHTPIGFNYDGGAQYYIYRSNFAQINSCSLATIVHRVTGRPFGLQRGRRRAVRR